MAAAASSARTAGGAGVGPGGAAYRPGRARPREHRVSTVAVLPGGRVVTGGGYDDRVRLRNVQSSSPGTLLACSAYGLATSLPHLEVASSSATQWAAFHAGRYAQRPRTRLEPGNVRGNAMPQQARASPRSGLNGGPDEELSRPRYGHLRDRCRWRRPSRSPRPGNQSQNRVSHRH